MPRPTSRPTPPRLRPRPFPIRLVAAVLGLVFVLASCGSDDASSNGSAGTGNEKPSVATGGTLRIGAIPDQDPEVLARNYALVADYLSTSIDADVEFVPVADYAAAVALFRTGDLDLVWFGGLTGVQARLETPGAQVVAERDIDQAFHSVFIASSEAGIGPVASVEELSVFEGRRFTFGSESSTSGRLMPQYFLEQAGVTADSFAGEAGFSGAHDKTIALVASGAFEAGVLNEQVWRKAIEDGSVDTAKVVEVFRTPPYHDYHWLLHPAAIERYGPRFESTVTGALTALSADDPDQAAILEFFGAGGFVRGDAGNYDQIEQIGRTLGLITG